jgi:hypothetical protein
MVNIHFRVSFAFACYEACRNDLLVTSSNVFCKTKTRAKLEEAVLQLPPDQLAHAGIRVV